MMPEFPPAPPPPLHPSVALVYYLPGNSPHGDTAAANPGHP